MTRPTNCPNCGAPIGTGDRCACCGTMFPEDSHISTDESLTRPTNCPNCGAPIGMDGRCPYCGTMFLDFSFIPMDEPFYLRVRVNFRGAWQGLITSRVICTSLTMEDIAIDTVPRICMEFMPIDEPIVKRTEEMKTRQ